MDREAKKLNIEIIKRHIHEETALRKVEGPRFNRKDRVLLKAEKKIIRPVKQETRLYRFAKKVQHKIRRYPFYTIVYNMAFKFKRFLPKYNDHQVVSDFLHYHDGDFISKAYQGILGRAPDPEGHLFFLLKLRDGQLSKVEILGKLRFSQEGRKKGRRVNGLFLRYAIASSYHIPIIGYVLHLVSAFVRLPNIVKYIRQLEAFTNARHAQHAELISTLEAKMNSVSREVNDLSSNACKTVTVINNLTSDISTITGDLNKTKYEFSSTFADVKSKIGNLQDTKAEGQAVSSIANEVSGHKSDILNLQTSLRNLFEEMRTNLTGILPAGQIKEIQKEESHLLDALYLAFEDRFRGNREEIKERTKVYLSFIEKATAGIDNAIVLDIGCGRGEWLQVLKENKFKAKGIDNNRIMVGQCRELGLDVIEDDVIQYLKEQKTGTFGAITGLHVVEHLSLPDLIQLLDEVQRTLRPGGVAIFETPNPENMMVGATFFHIDPTHDRPLHPLTLDFLLSQRGFLKTEIVRLHAMPKQSVDNEQLHNLLFGPQDYAAIGYKQ